VHIAFRKLVYKSWLLQEAASVQITCQQVSQITKCVTLLCNSMLKVLQLPQSKNIK